MKWPFAMKKTVDALTQERNRARHTVSVRDRELMDQQEQMDAVREQLSKWVKQRTGCVYEDITPQRTTSHFATVRPNIFCIQHEIDLGCFPLFDTHNDAMLRYISGHMHHKLMEQVRHEFRKVGAAC